MSEYHSKVISLLQAEMAGPQGSCKCPEAACCCPACLGSCSVAHAPGTDNHPLAAPQPKAISSQPIQQRSYSCLSVATSFPSRKASHATSQAGSSEIELEMALWVHPALGSYCLWAVATAHAVGWLDEPPQANFAVCHWLCIPHSGG